jgi:hypothetical protein
MIDLENILELEAKATPGPWALVVELAPLTLYLNDNFVQAERKEDIDLISAMRNSIKELCAELKAARKFEYEALAILDLKKVATDITHFKLYHALEKLDDAIEEARRG